MSIEGPMYYYIANEKFANGTLGKNKILKNVEICWTYLVNEGVDKAL